jgi:glycolate oxidase iron-sulfur subunit
MAANHSKASKVLEMDNADSCCGLGGSFRIAHREISLAIQDKKMDSLKRSGALAVVTLCPGCMAYLAHGIRRKRMSLEVMPVSRLKKNDVMENFN